MLSRVCLHDSPYGAATQIPEDSEFPSYYNMQYAQFAHHRTVMFVGDADSGHQLYVNDQRHNPNDEVSALITPGTYGTQTGFTPESSLPYSLSDAELWTIVNLSPQDHVRQSTCS